MQAARRDMTAEGIYGLLIQQAELASTVGARLIFYEGGQHMTPHPFGSEQPYNQVLMDIQHDEVMYDLYMEWLSLLEPLSDDILFMHYSFVRRPSGKSGSWGALEYQWEEPPFENSPKYRALLDYIYEGAAWTGAKSPRVLNGMLLEQNHPNPFSDHTSIHFRMDRPGDVELAIYDVLGREVAVLSEGYLAAGSYEETWTPGASAPGIYFARLRVNEVVRTIAVSCVR